MAAKRSTLTILKDTVFAQVGGSRELYLELNEVARLLQLNIYTVKELALRVPRLPYTELHLQRPGREPRLTTLYPVEAVLRLAFNALTKHESFQEFICLKVNRLLLDGFVSLEEFKLSADTRERLVLFITECPTLEELASRRGHDTWADALTPVEISMLRGLDLAVYLIARYTNRPVPDVLTLLQLAPAPDPAPDPEPDPT